MPAQASSAGRETVTAELVSSLGWLDYREDDARKARELLRAFEEKGTLDSLGIGTVRDGLADLLFPGLSTLHTRARYLLLLPWLYGRLERDVRGGHVTRSRVVEVARKREADLMKALSAGGSDPVGIIGVQAGEKVRVLPREVYWSALRRYGLLLFTGSSRSYLEALAAKRPTMPRRTRTDDGELLEAVSDSAWRGDLPEAPDNWDTRSTFDLSAEEALYLSDRISASVPGTLFTELLQHRPVVEGAEMVWDLPDVERLSVETQRVVHHASMFSRAIYGAQILYNILLLERMAGDVTGGEAEHLTDAMSRVHAQQEWWLGAMEKDAHLLTAWDRPDFWEQLSAGGARIPGPTRLFVDRWLNAALDDPSVALSDQEMRRAVEAREWSLKGGLARIRNPRARERAEPPYGLAPLDYRWNGVARQLISDITSGLARSGVSA